MTLFENRGFGQYKEYLKILNKHGVISIRYIYTKIQILLYYTIYYYNELRQCMTILSIIFLLHLDVTLEYHCRDIFMFHDQFTWILITPLKFRKFYYKKNDNSFFVITPFPNVSAMLLTSKLGTLSSQSPQMFFFFDVVWEK